MQYRTHLVTSLALTLPVMAATDTLSVGAVAAVSLGALFPDIDEPYSWIGCRTRGISDLINKLFGHRGMTHTVMGVLVIAITVSMMMSIFNLPFILGFYFVVGYSLHLVEDSFSKSGIKWLLPFSTKSYQSGLGKIYYRTGSWIENFILLGFGVLLIIQLQSLDYSNIFNQVISLVK